MKRLIRAMQQVSATTFFGSIGFNKQGQNYAGGIGLAQVRGQQQHLDSWLPNIMFLGRNLH